MELHQTTQGKSHGQQTTQPSVFTPPKPLKNGRRLMTASASLCSLEKKIPTLGEKNKRGEKEGTGEDRGGVCVEKFHTFSFHWYLSESLWIKAEVNRITQLLSSQRDFRILCTQSHFFFFIVVKNNSVWVARERYPHKLAGSWWCNLGGQLSRACWY